MIRPVSCLGLKTNLFRSGEKLENKATNFVEQIKTPKGLTKSDALLLDSCGYDPHAEAPEGDSLTASTISGIFLGLLTSIF